MPDARKPLQIKAFRASFTLLAARYVAAADVVVGGDLLLGLGQPPVQPVAAADDVRLAGGQLFRHQTAEQLAVILALQLLQHGVLLAHHVAEVQGVALRADVQRVAEGHLSLHLPLGAEVHEDLILNAPAGVGGELDALVRAEGVYRLDQPDGADGDEILLIGGLGVILLQNVRDKPQVVLHQQVPRLQITGGAPLQILPFLLGGQGLGKRPGGAGQTQGQKQAVAQQQQRGGQHTHRSFRFQPMPRGTVRIRAEKRDGVRRLLQAVEKSRWLFSTA